MTTVDVKQPCAWKEQAYPVPSPSRRGLRLKATALRVLHRWMRRAHGSQPAIVVVPALYNRLPGENVALGWLNEIDALGIIRQRMRSAARKTGWDVFTFHTLHNLDHFYDSTISAVRDTWTHEGSLPVKIVQETERRFGTVYDYHRVQPRLVENLVFQSALMQWTARRAEETPFQFHAVGTALYAALVWSGALTFDAALGSALTVGERWDAIINDVAEERATPTHGPAWQRFEIVRKLIENREHLSLAAVHRDLPKTDAPAKPFWFSTSGDEEPSWIVTARDAAIALESLNLKSWASDSIRSSDCMVRGLMASPLHPLAASCRWSLSNHLLSTPSAILMFMEYLAVIKPPAATTELEAQKRLRLSRMKVTGP